MTLGAAVTSLDYRCTTKLFLLPHPKFHDATLTTACTSGLVPLCMLDEDHELEQFVAAIPGYNSPLEAHVLDLHSLCGTLLIFIVCYIYFLSTSRVWLIKIIVLYA
jgi:hypothetical protein